MKEAVSPFEAVTEPDRDVAQGPWRAAGPVACCWARGVLLALNDRRDTGPFQV